ncbi:neuronal acetylcholine receptor subunit alpha-6 [Elysia marginata]|uniref:Neuronal acetylcholine receptor subunit alpha-6 n=1 Tax=Elysia marginata TaxID=1093978 RepID=A0AAV4GIW8_9GAST|nr:neuronal acetylcholine receptor subunit alpha-6 [Elysia marginata]
MLRFTLVNLALLIYSISADMHNFSSHPQSQLYKKFLTDIDHRVRPSLNVSIPTDVYVHMHLVSLREIVETQQYYHVNIWMEFSWKDEIRTWDADAYGGVRVIYPNPGDTWLPRVLISNSVAKRDLFSGENAIHIILSDGTTRWYPGDVIYASCTLDLTYFPFDSQVCTLWLIPQNLEWDVNLILVDNKVDTVGYSPNCEWKLDSTTTRKTSIDYDNISLGTLFFDFKFSRRPAFYLINAFAPVCAISLLAPLVFVLPEEGGERASYSVTLLLSLTVFLTSVSGKLPQCSQPLPLIVTYIFVMLIHSSLCVVCTVIQLKFLQRSSHQAAQNERPDELIGANHANQQTPKFSKHASDMLRLHLKENAADNQGSSGARFVGSKSEKLDRAGEYDGVNIHRGVLTTDIIKPNADKEDFINHNSVTYIRITHKFGYLVKLCLNNFNLLMLTLFYISWLAVSAYFVLQYFVEQSEVIKPVAA